MRNLWSYVCWGSRITLVIIALYLTAPLCRGDGKRATAKGWDRDFLEDDPDLNNRRFFLAILSSIDDRLTGYFAFRNESIGQILLHGTRTHHGEFWPVVNVQVANDVNGPWTTVVPSASPRVLTSIVVEPKSTSKLMIKLDTFLPLISNFKFGRVVLQNGEAAWFELKDLLPPTSSKVDGTDKKKATEE